MVVRKQVEENDSEINCIARQVAKAGNMTMVAIVGIREGNEN